MILVLCERDGRGITAPSCQALTLGRDLAAGLGAPLEAVLVGPDHAQDDGETPDDVTDDAPDNDGPGPVAHAGWYGAQVVHELRHELLGEYGPETWGQALRHAIEVLSPIAVLAPGSDRGNEVLAHAAARAELPMVANVAEAAYSGPAWELTRVRWGGSLLERATLDAEPALLSVAPHAVAAVEASTATPELRALAVRIDAQLARSVVRERVTTGTGVDLATAPVVVGGGRGVGSAEGFAPLERLADLLGGVVGCSRVVTNAGWRPHSDQVGQTGTAIAPRLYIACGISGAIQHWAGAKSAKHVLAINTDADANMVAKADYAVIGDLHQVLPAIVAAIESRD